MKSDTRYFNRELSWLEFNQRVLDLAFDAELPLLERLKFLAITANNLDEFFMVRVGGLQALSRGGSSWRDLCGLTPASQLNMISERVTKMLADMDRCYIEELAPALAEEGIHLLTTEQLNGSQREYARRIFESELKPLLTPIAVHEDDALPVLHGLRLCLLVKLQRETDTSFAVLPLGSQTQRLISMPDEEQESYLLLEDLVAMHVDQLFLGYKVKECQPFRVTRSADMAVREKEAPDLLTGMQQVLKARKVSEYVRVEIRAGLSKSSRQWLRKRLSVQERDVHVTRALLQMCDMMEPATASGHHHLQNKPWPALAPVTVDPKGNLFDDIASSDILLCHPYESYSPVVRLVEEAADDPEVLAIKQILYRTSKNSPIVKALSRAAAKGKYVTAVVELKARFDEARNIDWARRLAQDGVHVVYGVKGFKTHAKLCLVIRREGDGIRRYMHFGTGNYNEQTAGLYSDISYMTCNEELAQDATDFFNSITGFSEPKEYMQLAPAPTMLRDRLLELIHLEAERARQGQRAGIRAKMNSLVDESVIEALYEASNAGVQIELNVRGICCLRPNVPGLSENIRVTSIVDRYLEHARIVSFRNGGRDLLFISSADWMPRNLDKRIELLVPVVDRKCRKRLLMILQSYFKDNQSARQLDADGSWSPVPRKENASRNQAQRALYKMVRREVQNQERLRPTTFEPHLPPGED